jgi:hypothetical protein
MTERRRAAAEWRTGSTDDDNPNSLAYACRFLVELCQWHRAEALRFLAQQGLSLGRRAGVMDRAVTGEAELGCQIVLTSRLFVKVTS